MPEKYDMAKSLPAADTATPGQRASIVESRVATIIYVDETIIVAGGICSLPRNGGSSVMSLCRASGIIL